MRLVTNASPLIFLAKNELLPVLRSCFLRVLAPLAVVAETSPLPVPFMAHAACWIRVKTARGLLIAT